MILNTKLNQLNLRGRGELESKLVQSPHFTDMNPIEFPRSHSSQMQSAIQIP